MIVMTQFLVHSISYHGMLEPLAALFGSFLPIGLTIFGIQNGWVIGKFCTVDRDESPKSFWTIIALQSGLGSYLLCIGAWGLLH